MKILYAEDEEVLRELYAVQIESILDCQVIEVASGDQAVEILKNDPHIDLVLSDYRMPRGNGDVIYRYITEHKLNIPFFLISTYEPSECEGIKNFTSENPLNCYFPKPIRNFKEFAEKIKTNIEKSKLSNLSPTPAPSSKDQESLKQEFPENSDYCKIKLPRFLRFNNSNCAIYIKLSDNKFVKIVNKDDLYDSNLIEKYTHKNVHYFYIRSHDFLNFTKYYQSILESSLSDENEAGPSKTIDHHLASISFIHEVISNIGVTPQIIETVNKTVNSVIKFTKQNKTITHYLETILKQQNFIFEHSLMTAYLAVAIANEMGLTSNSTMEKLCIAALIHDVALEDSCDVPLEHIMDNVPKNLSQPYREMIFSHPVLAANMLKEQNGLPPDVDWIILCHHERPDGSGYPRGLSAEQIPPLACLFIIAEIFSRRLYAKSKNHGSIEQFAHEITTVFDKGNFKKPLLGLLSLLKSAKKI